MRTVALFPTHQRLTFKQRPGLTHFPDNCASSETSCSLLSQGGHCRGTPTSGTIHKGSRVPPRLGLRGLSVGPADRCHFSTARKAKPGPLSAHRSSPNSGPTAPREESCVCILFQEKKCPHTSIVLYIIRPLGWVVGATLSLGPPWEPGQDHASAHGSGVRSWTTVARTGVRLGQLSSRPDGRRLWQNICSHS